MTTLAIISGFWIGIPILSIWITGRSITWKGWLFFIALWPVAWLFVSPEELP